MKQFIAFALLVLTSIGLFSCFDKNQKTFMPKVSGKLGEVLLIMDEEKWQGESGRVLRTAIMNDYPSLPQSEKTFEVTQIVPQGFSNIYKGHRNIVRINIGAQYKKAVIKIKKDAWAVPQMLIDIEAPSDSSFQKLVATHNTNIESYLLDAEFERIIFNLKQNENSKVTKKLISDYDISLAIPVGYEIYATKPNFLWIHHETSKLHQGIWIYMKNYTDTAEFRNDALIALRNNVLKEHIPGPTDQSYMSTEMQLPVEFKRFEKEGNFTVEMRGLWRTEGDYMMGGPFMSHTTIDVSRNRFIMIEGFVYAGKQDKKLYMWQVEAIVRSLKILESEGADIIEKAK